MRVGLGYDIHPVCPGRPLVLGGVTIDHTHGLDGHSDADVLVHAVCDALLGAMGEEDVGSQYPSSDLRFKGMNSLSMLKAVMEKLEQRRFKLVNLDSVILAEAPRLGPYLAEMEICIAEVLRVDRSLVNVKVKSGDQVGVIGRKEGIGAQAICLLESL